MMEARHHVWRVRTPEGVAFSFRLASPALRAVALAIDAAAISAAWSILSIAINLLGWLSYDLATAVAIIAFFILSQGYRIYTEWAWRGQTLGKRVMRLRVVDERGLRLAFSQIALRNLLRFVDALPAAYLVGGLAALASARGQRLGDLAAGTLVVWEPPEPTPDFAHLRSEKFNSLREHPQLVARLRQTISAEEARVAWQALTRRDRLDPQARIRLFAQLAGHLRRQAGMPEELSAGLTDEQFVRNAVDVLFLNRAN
jgi:uncharacterized RDD family membrane protein YckC